MFVEGPPGTIGPDGKPTETVTEENFFFRLSDYQQQLTSLIESGELNIQPEARKNEVLSFVKSGLRDLSVSRSSFTWGIPVPEPAASETKQKHVIYVWLDALANYMTALGYGSELPGDQERFARYWPADLHLVGKEIIRFHCVYWPAFLLAAGLPLPKAVTAHGWLLFDDAKMSKSKGNIVRTETILDAFGQHVYKKQFPDSTKQEQDLFATDVLRYFLLREIPFGQDGSFSFDAMITRYNADLANGYGNLVSRTLTMIEKYFDGFIPVELDAQYKDGHTVGSKAHFIGVAVGGLSSIGITEIEQQLQESLSFSAFATRMQGLISWADEVLSLMKPWKQRESPEVTLNVRKQALYQSSETIRIITALFYPILPHATAKVWQQLGFEKTIEQAAIDGDLTNLQWGGLKPGTKLGPLSPIFPRADKGLAQIMIDIEAAKAAQAKPTVTDESTAAAPEPADSNHPGAAPRTTSFDAPNPGATVGGSHAVTTERTLPEAQANNQQATSSSPDQIAIDDFLKVDLRVAQILVAERIPKADKLLRLEVDLGPDLPRRQILSGIAEWYTPEELIGRRIVIVANLAPRKMRGLESHGMLLAASAGDHTKPVLTSFPETEGLPLGSRVR
jgi:methionyl-tRNA synthetase